MQKGQGVGRAGALGVATRRSREGGERNNQDRLEARREAYLARRDLAEARYRYINGWLALHREAGVLTPARLRQVSQALQGSPVPGEALSFSASGPSYVMEHQ